MVEVDSKTKTFEVNLEQWEGDRLQMFTAQFGILPVFQNFQKAYIDCKDIKMYRYIYIYI